MPDREPSPESLFEILVREHEQRLRAFVLSLVREDAAVDDLVQEAFLVAWRNLDRYDRARPFGPWLRGIGRRLCLAHWRRQRRDRHSFVEEEVVEGLCALHDALEASRGDTLDAQLASLRACMERLPEHQRRVLDLHYEEDLPCATIAERLGRTREAVKKLLQRSRAWLARCIEERLRAIGAEA